MSVPFERTNCELVENIGEGFLVFSPVINAVIYSFLGRKFRKDCMVKNTYYFIKTQFFMQIVIYLFELRDQRNIFV
jgi:hypothetical protein